MVTTEALYTMSNNDELHKAYLTAQMGSDENADHNMRYVKLYADYYGVCMKVAIDRIKDTLTRRHDEH